MAIAYKNTYIVNQAIRLSSNGTCSIGQQ